MKKLITLFAGLSLLAVTLAGIGIALVIGVLGAITFSVVRMMRSKPVYVRSRASHDTPKEDANGFRVWNDGRGTIIDM